VHAGADGSVLGDLSLALLSGDELERAKEACSIAHGEELLRVRTVALTTKGLGHGQAELEAGVVVRLNLAVASLSRRACVGGVLRRFSPCEFNELKRRTLTSLSVMTVRLAPIAETRDTAVAERSAARVAEVRKRAFIVISCWERFRGIQGGAVFVRCRDYFVWAYLRNRESWER
jgi:hypothetical protein